MFWMCKTPCLLNPQNPYLSLQELNCTAVGGGFSGNGTGTREGILNTSLALEVMIPMMVCWKFEEIWQEQELSIYHWWTVKLLLPGDWQGSSDQDIQGLQWIPSAGSFLWDHSFWITYSGLHFCSIQSRVSSFGWSDNGALCW
jgi:hypothetical protein